MNVSSLDLLVICVPLALVFGVSMYMRRYMRSVADFLAAGRCAGRYLISTAVDATGSSVVALIAAFEVFSKAGFSLSFWNSFTAIIFFFFGVLGLIGFRFRETRALTFHQFFEIRYSKGVRVFSSVLNVFSGLFNFGVQPAVGARFFVYFCGLPETVAIGPVTVQTFIVIMVILMGISMHFALTGGQISVMVTDCLENVISSFFYIIIALFVVCTISVGQMHEALTSGGPGSSYVDPFDIGSRADFDGWYVILALLFNIYFYRGNAWQQGFAAAAKNAHEGRMAQILGNWRSQCYLAMGGLVSIAAFTMMHHPDFSTQRILVEHNLQNISLEQLRSQMSMPMALGVFLIPGIKGCFMAVLLFGLLASQGMQLHSYGSTVLQDLILPLRKKPFSPKAHIRALRIAVLGVALFVCTFSAIFKPVDYLIMITMLIGSIYLGGIGLVVWGGLYWSRGTTAGAWTALSLGGALGIGFNLVQQLWKPLDAWLVTVVGPGNALGRWLLSHPDRCPLNGLELSVLTAAIAGTGYVVVSLLTCRKPFNLDEMLHRGIYKIREENAEPAMQVKRSFWSRLIQIDEHFSWGDKVLTVCTTVWVLSMNLLAVGVLLWTLCVGRLSQDWWFHYMMTTAVWLNLFFGIVAAVWFAIGVTRDLRALFATLSTRRRVDADDGTVKGHRNAGEESPVPVEAD